METEARFFPIRQVFAVILGNYFLDDSKTNGFDLCHFLTGIGSEDFDRLYETVEKICQRSLLSVLGNVSYGQIHESWQTLAEALMKKGFHDDDPRAFKLINDWIKQWAKKLGKNEVELAPLPVSSLIDFAAERRRYDMVVQSEQRETAQRMLSMLKEQAVVIAENFPGTPVVAILPNGKIVQVDVISHAGGGVKELPQ